MCQTEKETQKEKFETIHETALHEISDKSWEELIASDKEMIEFVKLLAENMSFNAHGEVAKQMIDILQDYVEEPRLGEQLSNGIDILVRDCEEEETKSP